ncbi:MAG: APC family permease [Actinobacteria bacterium]|nr:APC family permease [Actinomycetota bacterium]MCL5446836.1 APC family permease [Actinomycetota bacterium]
MKRNLSGFSESTGPTGSPVPPGHTGGKVARIWKILVGPPLRADQVTSEELSPVDGLPALSLDALTSVAYGPQAIALVLAGAGAVALKFALPITIAIVALLALLVLSYRQVIEGFPQGGGAYAVSRAHLGAGFSRLAAASLIVDYTLTVAVSIAAGVAGLVSAFQSLAPYTVMLCLAMLAIITLLNLRGLGDSARAFLLPTAAFIVGLLAVIIVGIIHPIAPHVHQPGKSLVATHALQVIGVLLILKAFSSGCSALTGVEAIANGVPLFERPRVKRAKQTELLLGVILAAMLLGLGVLIAHFHVAPRMHDTVLSQVMAISVGRTWAYYTVTIAITIVLGMAANTSFGGLPILASLLARDNYLPHLFSMRGDRLVYTKGVWALAVFSGLILVVVSGNTDTLIPLFAIGVFTGFTLAQAGMVIHWRSNRTPRWHWRAVLNAVGAVVTGIATLVFVISKFAAGAWIVVVAVPAIILLFQRVHRYYEVVGKELDLSGATNAPAPHDSLLVVVPITGITQLSMATISQAMTFGGEVVAVHVAFSDAGDEEGGIIKHWERWNPGVPLVMLQTRYHSVIRPITRYVLQAMHDGKDVVVLIGEMEPRLLRHRLLHNQMGTVLSMSLRRHTDATVAILPMHVND